MLTTSTRSLLMASAALVACLSNPVSAMNDDRDSACCGVKKAVITHVAKKAEDYVLETAYTKTLEQLEPQIEKYCSETFGDGIGSTILSGISTGFSAVGLNYLKGKVGIQ